MVELVKKGIALIFILANPSQCYLSMSVCVCACVRACVRVCVLFIHTISIICVLKEELSITACNQQIYDFYKREFF